MRREDSDDDDQRTFRDTDHHRGDRLADQDLERPVWRYQKLFERADFDREHAVRLAVIQAFDDEVRGLRRGCEIVKRLDKAQTGLIRSRFILPPSPSLTLALG